MLSWIQSCNASTKSRPSTGVKTAAVVTPADTVRLPPHDFRKSEFRKLRQCPHVAPKHWLHCLTKMNAIARQLQQTAALTIAV